MAKLRRTPVAAVLLLALGVACGLLGCVREAPQPTALSTGLPPPPGQVPQAEPTLSPAGPSPQAQQGLTLTLWTTEAFSPTQTIAPGRILAAQAAALPDLRLRFVLKQPYGQAGILRYLITTANVVPALLPDLAFIDVDEVGEAVQAGLVQPLASLLPPDLVGDLYAFARDACTFGGQLYCLQFQADLDHLVYNSFRLERPPASWTGVLSQSMPYVFPAGGQGGLVNDSFLVQYEAVRLRSEETAPGASFLDETSLVAILRFYRDGVSRGVLPLAILDYHSTDDSWRAYRAGQAAMAQVSAHRYLTERSQAVFARPAPIPAISGPAAPISRGWALVLITPDPARQAAAVRFLELWLSPEVNAAWTQASSTLPTRHASLARWGPMDGYTSFLQQQLLAARPRPTVQGYSQVAAALQRAVEAVLTGELTPEKAAAQATKNGP